MLSSSHHSASEFTITQGHRMAAPRLPGGSGPGCALEAVTGGAAHWYASFGKPSAFEGLRFCGISCFFMLPSRGPCPICQPESLSMLTPPAPFISLTCANPLLLSGHEAWLPLQGSPGIHSCAYLTHIHQTATEYLILS